MVRRLSSTISAGMGSEGMVGLGGGAMGWRNRANIIQSNLGPRLHPHCESGSVARLCCVSSCTLLFDRLYRVNLLFLSGNQS